MDPTFYRDRGKQTKNLKTAIPSTPPWSTLPWVEEVRAGRINLISIITCGMTSRAQTDRMLMLVKWGDGAGETRIHQ